MAEIDMELKNKDLETAVFESLGAASTCWENLEGAGVFESTRCKEIGDQLLERIQQEVVDHG